MAKARKKHLFDGDVTSYNESFLLCRDIMHHWIPANHWEVSRGLGSRVIEYRRSLHCANCPTVRKDKYDQYMRPVGRVYQYPEGYCTDKGTHIDPAAARLEQIRRSGLEAPRTRRRRLRAI